MFERFTDRARRVVVAAQDEARMLGHNHIGSEHLLLGLLSVPGGTAVSVLEAAGVTAEAARVQVEEISGPGSKSPRGHIPFTPRAKKILELSLREALEQKKSYIGTEHILLGLMRDADGIGARVLQRLGCPLDALRQRVLAAGNASATDDAVTEEESAPEAGPWNWQLAQPYGREAGIRPQSVPGFSGILMAIDQRLTNIERHLGITSDEAADPGFRGLITSVDRHLASIERHLGMAAGQDAAAEAPDTQTE